MEEQWLLMSRRETGCREASTPKLSGPSHQPHLLSLDKTLPAGKVLGSPPVSQPRPLSSHAQTNLDRASTSQPRQETRDILLGISGKTLSPLSMLDRRAPPLPPLRLALKTPSPFPVSRTSLAMQSMNEWMNEQPSTLPSTHSQTHILTSTTHTTSLTSTSPPP